MDKMLIRGTEFAAMHLWASLSAKIDEKQSESRALKQQSGYDPDDEVKKKEVD